jgi:hypothetical protein
VDGLDFSANEMNAEGSQTNPQKGKRKSVRGRGCLIIVAVILLLLLLGVARIYRPQFASSFPARIGIEAPQFDGKEDYRASISNRNACSSVIKFFEAGELEMPCMCKEYARFEIYYKNGDVDHVDLLSGHRGPSFFQIRRGLWHYRLSRKEFCQIIGQAGIDGSKLFAYEDLLYSGSAPATKHQEAEAVPPNGP